MAQSTIPDCIDSFHNFSPLSEEVIFCTKCGCIVAIVQSATVRNEVHISGNVGLDPEAVADRVSDRVRHAGHLGIY